MTAPRLIDLSEIAEQLADELILGGDRKTLAFRLRVLRSEFGREAVFNAWRNARRIARDFTEEAHDDDES